MSRTSASAGESSSSRVPLSLQGPFVRVPQGVRTKLLHTYSVLFTLRNARLLSEQQFLEFCDYFCLFADSATKMQKWGEGEGCENMAVLFDHLYHGHFTEHEARIKRAHKNELRRRREQQSRSGSGSGSGSEVIHIRTGLPDAAMAAAAAGIVELGQLANDASVPADEGGSSSSSSSSSKRARYASSEEEGGEEEEELVLNELHYENAVYLIDLKTNLVYDPASHQELGTFDPAAQRCSFRS